MGWCVAHQWIIHPVKLAVENPHLSGRALKWAGNMHQKSLIRILAWSILIWIPVVPRLFPQAYLTIFNPNSSQNHDSCEKSHCTERNSSGKERKSSQGSAPVGTISLCHTHTTTALSPAPLPGTGVQSSISRYRDINDTRPGTPSDAAFPHFFSWAQDGPWGGFVPWLSGAGSNPSAGGWLLRLETGPSNHCWCRHLALKVKEIQLNLGPVNASSPW